jgi:hypothetical protein
MDEMKSIFPSMVQPMQEDGKETREALMGVLSKLGEKKDSAELLFRLTEISLQ